MRVIHAGGSSRIRRSFSRLLALTAKPAVIIFLWAKHELCGQHSQNLATFAQSSPRASCLAWFRRRRYGVEDYAYEDLQCVTAVWT